MVRQMRERMLQLLLRREVHLPRSAHGREALLLPVSLVSVLVLQRSSHGHTHDTPLLLWPAANVLMMLLVLVVLNVYVEGLRQAAFAIKVVALRRRRKTLSPTV